MEVQQNLPLNKSLRKCSSEPNIHFPFENQNSNTSSTEISINITRNKKDELQSQQIVLLSQSQKEDNDSNILSSQTLSAPQTGNNQQNSLPPHIDGSLTATNNIDFRIQIDNAQAHDIEEIPAQDNPNDRQLHNQEQIITNEEESLSKTAIYRLGLQFCFNLFILACNILGYLFIQDIISLRVLLGCCLFFIFLYMFATIKTRGFSSREEASTFDIVLSVANSFALAVYVTVAILIHHGYSIPLYPFGLLGGFVIILSCGRIGMETPGPVDIFFLMDKAFLWVELFVVGLKIEGLSLSWSTIFIPLYFLLMVLVFSSLLIILSSLFTFCSVMREEGPSSKLLIGSLWYIMNSFYTVIWFGIALEGAKQLDNRTSSLSFIVKAGIIHSAILFVFNMIFWRVLFRFQEFEVQGEMIEEEEFETYSQNGFSGTQVKFQVCKEDPTNLIMISPTFFKYFKKNNKKRKTEKQPYENFKTEPAIAKFHSTPNRAALNIRFPSENVMPEHYNFSPDKQFPPNNLDFSGVDLDARKTHLRRRENTQSCENLCTICYDQSPNAVYMDCGHGGICYECALESWKKSDKCILCRQKIHKVLKIMIIKPFDLIKVVESTKKVIVDV